MKIHLLYFHRTREAAGRASETAELWPGVLAADALAWAAARHPGIEEIRSMLRLAVNEEYASADRPLQEGDTVALLPPLSGG